jgi:hypothetical protein
LIGVIHGGTDEAFSALLCFLGHAARFFTEIVRNATADRRAGRLLGCAGWSGRR